MPIYTENEAMLVDMKTGEMIALLEGPQVITARTKESHEQARKHADKGLVYGVPGRRSQEKHAMGDFTWAIFDTYKILFRNIKPATLSRLMILSTYMNYKNELVNSRGRPLNKHELANIMKVTYKMGTYVIKELEEAGLMSYRPDDEVYKLSGAAFGRGKLNKSKINMVRRDSKMIKRLYVRGVKALFDPVDAMAAERLSRIFRIMPFVNQEYNIVCKEPLEDDRELIRPMSIGDVADMIGYGRTNAPKLRSMLLDTTFDVGNGPVQAVRYVPGEQFGYKGDCLFIDPEIYYGGNSFEEVKAIGELTRKDAASSRVDACGA